LLYSYGCHAVVRVKRAVPREAHMTDTQLLDMDGAANYLAITRRQFAANWRAWQIPVIRLGHRTLRWRREDLDAWCAKRARRAVA
jgi:predicted DNA-binding transcriptional regulator AlpA